tara:strand:- start:1256 stop:1492 length:237 start_codon:yes stop_codon:yes gene_type:complete
MNEAQQQYIRTFYSFYSSGGHVIGWTDEEVNDAALERAKSMRSNVDSFDSERFTKQEWLEILNHIISECELPIWVTRE